MDVQLHVSHQWRIKYMYAEYMPFYACSKLNQRNRFAQRQCENKKVSTSRPSKGLSVFSDTFLGSDDWYGSGSNWIYHAFYVWTQTYCL